MKWKPMSEYPTDEHGNGPAVLARPGMGLGPLIIRRHNGNFYTIPGIPMWYGDQQFGFMTVNCATEFMELPE